MSLDAGTRLGPYEIVEPIGKGGMGEVYRARDTKLDRDVAIKVLPDELAADEERVARFEREAKLLASLNHPNIASIYGFESNSLVLELVEGPTLADRIEQGPLPIDETIAIAKQIAEALEAGHEAGVIHRDLKPANIKVRDDGTVKVLDYGLAKALEAEAADGGDAELSHSPTLTRQGTQLGVILGTAAYMSPEQAKGKRVDRRTDIWAFGAVVYEMLTGKRAFVGADVSEVLASVLAREPDWTVLPGGLSEVRGTYLRRCLRKDPKERIRDIGDVRLALDGAFDVSNAPAPSPASDETVTSHGWRAVAFAVAAALISGAAVWSLTRQPDTVESVARSSVEASNAIVDNLYSDLALARDGSFVVYEGRSPNNVAGELYLRRLDQLDSSLLRGTEGGVMPFVSPDGQWVGFFVGSELKKVSVSGAPPVTVAKMPSPPRGASWGDDDQIIVGSRDAGLFRVSAGGGVPEQLTEPEGTERHSWPQWIPNRQALLFTMLVSTDVGFELAALPLENGEVKKLGIAGTAPRFLHSGHFVYALPSDGSMAVASFDPARLEVVGSPLPLIENVSIKISGAASFDVSDAGRVVYLPGVGGGRQSRRLVWVSRDGREEAIDAPAGEYYSPQLSPDGSRVAVDRRDGDRPDVWILDLARGSQMKLTTDVFVEMNPLWTPDGERVVYGMSRNENDIGLFRRSADGTGEAEPLLVLTDETVAAVGPTGWSPDGATLAYWIVRGGPDIRLLSLDDDGSDAPLLASEFSEQGPAISPDGKWMAYVSDESGQLEVYVQRFPNLGGRVSVSTAGGRQPLWSRDGTELFYRSPAGVVAVPVNAGDSFTAGEPEVLFEDPYFLYLSRRTYDVSPDGQRFLMVSTGVGGDAGPVRIQIIENWFSELERLVPTAN